MTDSPVTVRELQALSTAINAIKKDMAQMFKNHEEQERLMLEPMIAILEKHDASIFGTDDDNPGLKIKVDRLETHKSNTGVKMSLLAFFTTTNFLELIKRIFVS